MSEGRRGGKKNRKWDRNKTFCKVYRAHNTREKNKLVRLKRHLTRFPGDLIAIEAVRRCKLAITGFAQKEAA